MDRRFRFKDKAIVVLIFLLIVSVSVAMVLNVVQFRSIIHDTTKTYVNDVAYQMTREIDARLTSIRNGLDMLQDNIKGNDRLEEQIAYLNHKAELLGFSAFAIVDGNGNALFSDGSTQDISQISAFSEAVNGGHGVSFLEGQSVMYTVPISREGEIVGVLAGVLDKASMQRLIETNGFGGHGVSCIIDQNFRVIVSPKDMHFFFALDDVFQEKKDQALLNDIVQMEENVRNQVDGNLSFVTVNGREVLMSYNALSPYDWVLLTIVPTDFISAETDKNVFLIYLIAILTILGFLVIMISVLYNWKRHRRELERVAYTDRVTGEMNLFRFCHVGKRLLASKPPASYYMVSLNVKSFKLINEKFGRAEGDKILCHILRVVNKNLCEDELAVRAEGDNFFLCVHAVAPEELQKRLDTIINEINQFSDAVLIPYKLTFLQGAYLIDDVSVDITTILDRANIARKNQAREKEAVCFFYNETLIHKLQMEQELTALMEPSLQNGDFKVYLQPKVRLSDRKTGGAEALIRWQHPERGMIYPSDFIPLFEKNGAICKLDLYVFEQVCKLQKQRLEGGKSIFPISVNLSRQHLKNLNFLSDFIAIKDKYKIPDGLLELELTESIVFDGGEISYVKSMIDHMHRAGFLCSLDDFGFGYSSLSLLSEFDVDTIKLDRSFFDCDMAERSQWVVEAIVNLSKKLSILIVAEGIEAEPQLAFLEKTQCDLVQGYVFSKPLPVDEFEQWVEENDKIHTS